MRELYFLILPVIFLYVFVRSIHDKKATFEKFLKRELESKGLILVSSQPCENKYIPEIENIPSVSAWEKRRIGLGTMVGGRSTWFDDRYRVIRKVEYKDDKGNKKEAYAAVEFSGFFARRFLGISWTQNQNEY